MISNRPSTQSPFPGEKLRSDGHWSADLHYGWAMNEGAGCRIRDAVTGEIGTLHQSNLPEWKGKGLYFSGNDHIRCGDLAPTAQLTFVTKVNFDALADFPRICGKHGGPGSGDYGFLFAILGTGAVEFKRSTSGSDWSGATSATGLISTGTDYTAALTYGDGNARLYLNGEEQTSGDFPMSLSGNIYDSSRDFWIGSDYRTWDAGDYFSMQGFMDYFWWYDRVLSAREIKKLYHEDYLLFHQPRSWWSVAVAAGLSIPVAMKTYRNMRT